MSDLNPTQRQEALDTIDDAMRVLGGMGRQGLNVRLQRLRKALSNPTSSVSTEGVALREARNKVAALHHGATHEYADGYNNGVRAAVRVLDAAIRGTTQPEPTDPMCAVHTFVRLRDCEVHGP